MHVGRVTCVVVVCLSGTTTDLGEKEVDTEWPILIVEIALELSYLFAKHVRRVANLLVLAKARELCYDTHASNDTHASSVRDSGSELRASCDVHASQENRMVNLKQICEGCPYLLRRHGGGIVDDERDSLLSALGGWVRWR